MGHDSVVFPHCFASGQKRVSCRVPDPAAAKCFHSLPCSCLWSVNGCKAFHSRAGFVRLTDTPHGDTLGAAAKHWSSHSFSFQVWRIVTQGGAGRATPSCLGSSCHQIRPESLSHLLILSIFKVFPSLSNAYHAAHLSLPAAGTAEGLPLTLGARCGSTPLVFITEL